MTKAILLLTGFLTLVSCSKETDSTIETNLDVEISKTDTLKVSLGYFGDEEGAVIHSGPQNAQLSSLSRDYSSGLIVYKYLAKDTFTGTDKTVLTLRRGSNGASTGTSEALTISIRVK